MVLIRGQVYTARDVAHLRLCQALDNGLDLPFPLDGAIIYYLGPTPGRPGRPIGAAGPTTSSRMDRFTPALLARGLKATIGKGYRNSTVREALMEFCAVHLTTIGGAGAHLSQFVIKAEPVAFEDLGPEAILRLTVEGLPAFVAYDSYGGTIYVKDPI